MKPGWRALLATLAVVVLTLLGSALYARHWLSQPLPFGTLLAVALPFALAAGATILPQN